jgi:pimeloyl-ACP methyl ester carboxylesterase
MKRTLPLLVLASLSGGAAFASEAPVVGHWEGAVARLGSVQTVQVDVREEGGALVAAFDIPDRDLVGEPVKKVEYEAPVLRLTGSPYGDGVLKLDVETGEMTGIFEAWEPDVRIHLKRRPAPPPTVREEEVRFRNDSVALAGTLILPLTPGPHPAVVLVHGSAAPGRSDARYRSKGLFFARHGIAALVYDKRQGFENATFDELAADAAAAVRFLKTRRDVDADRIGLAGFSQGGWLAPMAAAQVDGVSFLILQVAPAVSVEEQEVQRVRYGMAAEGSPEEDILRAVAYTRLMFDTAYRGGDWSKLAAATEKARSQAWAGQVQLASSPEDLQGWRRQQYDPEPVLRRTTIPVLALYGERDTVVPPAENAEKMRGLLEEAGNRQVTIKIFPRANHSLEWYGELRQGTWSWPDGYWIWAKAAPGYAETVIGWLHTRLK